MIKDKINTALKASGPEPSNATEAAASTRGRSNRRHTGSLAKRHPKVVHQASPALVRAAILAIPNACAGGCVFGRLRMLVRGNRAWGRQGFLEIPLEIRQCWRFRRSRNFHGNKLVWLLHARAKFQDSRVPSRVTLCAVSRVTPHDSAMGPRVRCHNDSRHPPFFPAARNS